MPDVPGTMGSLPTCQHVWDGESCGGGYWDDTDDHGSGNHSGCDGEGDDGMVG